MIGLWIALGMLALVLFLCSVASIYLILHSFTRISNPSERFTAYCERLREKGLVAMADKLSKGKEALDNEAKEDVWIMANDGKKLHGVVIESNSDTTQTAILVHGYRGQGGSDFATVWQYYKSRGYRVVVIDQRSHGQSEGYLITFGKREQYDVANWVEYVLSTYGENQDIVLHGVSMGAATVMLSTSLEENAGRIKALVADCGYLSPKQQFTHMFKTMHLPHFPLFHIANFWMKCICGYWFGELHTGQALAKINIPVLLIHGAEDYFVPTECSRINFEFANEPKTLYLVPDAPHAAASMIDTEGYFDALDEFFGNITNFSQKTQKM